MHTFFLAMCYYESIVDEKKDLMPLLKAQKKFKFIVKEYPETRFCTRFSIQVRFNP